MFVIPPLNEPQRPEPDPRKALLAQLLKSGRRSARPTLPSLRPRPVLWSRRGSDSDLSFIESRPAQHLPRLLPRVDARCVRFFSPHLRRSGRVGRVFGFDRQGDLCHHAHAHDATTGRADLRAARRPVRAAGAADGGHHFLFADGIADRVFAELHRVSHFSRALRDRDGWRVGTRRIARDGKFAGARPRPGLRDSAARLFLRFPSRCGGLLARLPVTLGGGHFLSWARCRRCS